MGLLGIGSFLMALLGVIFSVCAWKSVDGGLLMKRIAMIINVLSLLFSVVLYVWGWM